MRVFISHSSKDACKAVELCSYLEENNLQCWIAPRDIPIGMPYGDAIDQAFEESAIAIFLLSQASVSSIQVEQELYLANNRQKDGLRIIPVYIEAVELKRGFRYVLSSKQAFFWNSTDDLEKLLEAISEKEHQAKSHEHTQLILNTIKECIKKFYETNYLKYCDASLSEDILPNVTTTSNWITSEITTIDLLSSVKLLWKQNNWNTLYIGKSGFGKTTGLFSILKNLSSEVSSLVFYIYLPECDKYSGTNRITQHLYRSHIEQFCGKITFEQFQMCLFEIRENKQIPHVILLLDGLSECSNNIYEDLQFELNKLMATSTIQLLLTSATENHMFYLGNMTTQYFKLCPLSKIQIDTYLSSLGLQNDLDIPYEILSNPLILTLYGKTNSFFNKYHGNMGYNIRTSNSETDILWNYLEMVAVKFAERRDESEERIKLGFIFRFILPQVAYELISNGNNCFSLREFCNYANTATSRTQDDYFIDTFDEYFGFENTIVFSTSEYRTLLDYTLIQQLGLIFKNHTNVYEFSSSKFLHFFTGVHLYNELRVANNSNQQARCLKKTFYSYETCKHLGNLTIEQSQNNNANHDGSSHINKTNLLVQALDSYRNEFGKEAQIAVSNITNHHELRFKRHQSIKS